MRMRPSAMFSAMLIPLGSLTSDGGAPAPRRPPARPALFRDGQEAGHGRPPPWLARDLHGSSVLVDDAVAEGQPQSQASRLGREEGREELGPRRLGNARALVG